MPPPTDAEIKHAQANLTFKGVGLKGRPEDDSHEVRFPFEKIGVFDSEVAQELHGWTDEQRKLIEQRLLEGPDIGTEYIVYDPPKAAKPWPKYDDLKAVGQRTPEKVAQRIVEMVGELGLDAAQVAQYERENANRPYVLDALAALDGPEIVVEDEIEVPA